MKNHKKPYRDHTRASHFRKMKISSQQHVCAVRFLGGSHGLQAVQEGRALSSHRTTQGPG